MIIQDILSAKSAREHMEADSRLLADSKTGPRFRIYTWDHPAVTVGRFQSPEMCIGADCSDYALRPSGGLAVLHGHDLTVSIAARHNQSDGRSPRLIYHQLAGILSKGLTEYGREVQFGGAPPGADKAAIQNCFLSKGVYDIIDSHSGEKICGCALQVSQVGSLLQCSIPVREPDVDPSRWIIGSKRQPVSKMNQGTLIECLEKVMIEFAVEFQKKNG